MARRSGADAIAAKLRARFYAEVQEAQVAVFGAPPVDGLGNAGGFKMMIEDRSDQGLDRLQGQADALAQAANEQRGLVGVINTFRADAPQLYVDVDRTKCKMAGVPLSEVFNTLQYYLGGYYVNDFNQFGRTWQVNVQAEAPYRLTAAGVKQLKVRDNQGEMVPLGTLCKIEDSTGPVLLTRYNMYPAAGINGAWLPGMASGQVIQTMETLADEKLASGMAYDWTELTFMQTAAGGTAVYAFAGAVLMVFLVLAGLYESWSMPLAVILVVPMCVLCAVVGVAIARMDINIFVQVGLVVLVGLASKNAILVVEFARSAPHPGSIGIRCHAGRCQDALAPDCDDLVRVYSRRRSAGDFHWRRAEMRRTLGTAVFSGMLGVTAFGLLLTPVFYYVIERLFGRSPTKPSLEHGHDKTHAASDGHGGSPGQQQPTPKPG